VETGQQVEDRLMEVVRNVKAATKLPVSVKLSPFFSSMPNLCCKLDDMGVAGLVLFNRFYQPDIDVEELEVVPSLQLSDSSELLLRLRWLAILSGHFKGSLACSGGVHSHLDAIKAVMTGAHAVQLVSVLLKRGPEYVATLRDGMARWMEEHEYASIEQMLGSMSHQNSPNPQALERANYMRILQGWKP
jgi:dihydroorotate dehydrogenase (fumarate)